MVTANFPIHVSLGDAFEVRRALEAGNTEIGVAVDDGFFDAFQTTVLFEGRFVLTELKPGIHKKHLLIGDKGKEVDTLLTCLRQMRFHPQHITTIQSWQVMASLASQGIGAAWIPDFILKSRPALKLVRNAPNLPEVPCRIILCHKNSRRLSRNAQTLCSVLKAHNNAP